MSNKKLSDKFLLLFNVNLLGAVTDERSSYYVLTVVQFDH